MAKRRTATKKAVEETDDQRPPRRRGRVVRRLVVLALLVVGLIGVAPWVIANSPLRDMLLNWQMPVGGWRIQCQSAGLSWTGSQSLTNVAILDPNGNPLTTVESLSLERSLLGLAINSRDLGTLRTVKPTVYLTTRADGSNVEDFLAALEKQQASAESGAGEAKDKSRRTLKFEIIDATLRGLDSIGGEEWKVRAFNLSAARDSRQTLSADGTAVIAVKGSDSGRIKFRVISIDNGRQQFDLLAEGASLAPLAPWLGRWVGPCQLAGVSSLDAHAVWTDTADGGMAVDTWGRVEASSVSFTGEALKSDKLSIDKLVIPWKLTAANGELVAEEFKLDCGWAQLDAAGSLPVAELSKISLANLPKRELEIDAKLSLVQLATMLPVTLQIREGVRIDSGDVELTAQAANRDGKFTWSANVSLANLAGQDHGRTVEWKQPLKLAATWVESPPGSRLDRVKLSAAFAEGDFATTEDHTQGQYKLDLSQLAQELSQFVDLQDLTCRGTAQGNFLLTASEGDVQVTGIEGVIDDLYLRRGTIAVDEPHVEFTGDCRWNLAERSFSSRAFQLASSVVAFRSRDLRAEFPPGRVPVMTGDLAIRADLERLSRAAGLSGSWPRGSASSVMRLAANSEQVLADFSVDAEDLQLVKQQDAGPPAVVWSDPKIHSAGKAVYATATQRASIDNWQIDGQTMRMAGAAAWDKPLSGGPVVVNGTLQYDPAMLAGLIANYAGPNIQVEGDGTVRFEARGTLPPKREVHWSRSWQANAESGWTRAAVFGLPISAAKLQGTLAEGQLRTMPLDVSVGDGRLTAHPLAIFDPQPQQIILPAGQVITDVQISPAVSEQMLKYVAPILAGATRVDGQFSLNLHQTQIPLADPKQTRTAGTLAVHQLTVSPGPLLVDIVNLIQRVQSLRNPQDLISNVVVPKPTKLLSMNDQQIEFKIESGRVYHRKLEFIIDDVPISSTGSVGFDQTLALVIEIPIQDRWIDGEEALSGLAGQTLQIPIQGTFQKPQVDERAIADITRQLIRNTAGQAIGNEINRQLEKLFQGK